MGAIHSLWLRDIYRLKREPSRWIGVIAQPLLFWVILGGGLNQRFFSDTEQSQSYLMYFYPGALVMMVLFTSIFSSISLIEDKQTGFLRAVLVSPESPVSIVLGKLLGVMSIVFLQTLVFLCFITFAGYQFQEVNWFLTFGIIFLGAWCLSAVNYSAAWIMNSIQGYHGVMTIVFLPMWMISGALFPLKGSWMSVAQYLNPISYFIDILRFALEGRDMRDFSSLYFQLFALVFYCFVFMIVAYFATKYYKRDEQ
jgi:ABC-2 type transport system permease protein